MQVSAIVRGDKDALLYHPTLGFVRWKEEVPGSEGRVLVWAMGPEQGEPLVVDDMVLFSNLWETATEGALLEAQLVT